MTCSYCGNGSGKLDTYGNCISCGAPIKIHPTKIEEKVQNNTYYMGHSGSSYISPNIPIIGTYYGYLFDGSIDSINTIRKHMKLPEISWEEFINWRVEFHV